MSRASRAFDQHRGGPSLRAVASTPSPDDLTPYATATPGELPPMMFQLRLSDGRWLSYSYGDVREVECRDAGHLQITVLAASRTVITIEGRHLRELATLFGLASVRWIQEADPRLPRRSEDQAEVIRISIEVAGAE
ncbi:hypothetical protein Enr13x_23620 [Stieleria neptunia]|uniref:Uncharacterized protein n=1 Tax=Stieleria neptunia TaxID=2527979 RepID=A0A518HNU2_9BACT|nr:hypothetical protein [Stieleria neptunia]QDV42514.1 hypothetical protein Enr13x_23620 [Stieleria neptunia]